MRKSRLKKTGIISMVCLLCLCACGNSQEDADGRQQEYMEAESDTGKQETGDKNGAESGDGKQGVPGQEMEKAMR